MKELMNLTGIVKRILVEQENTRNSDWDLYYAVCSFINPSVLSAKFGTVLKSRQEYGIPTIESVGRARRKIVENYPELAGNEEVEGGRWSYEQKFRQFAREGV